jgi:glycosyltransferase involved in cell wall biosynthesis
MRIAYLAPLVESVPPALYGGTERVIAWLTEEMVRRGHEVTLFASGDSRTNARLVPGAPRALRLAGVRDAQPLTLSMVADAFARAHEFDIVHSHVDWLAFPFGRLIVQPVVHTLHGRLDLPFLPEIYARHPELDLVSISEAQRIPLPGVRFLATVHHGLPADLYAPAATQEDYVLFLGRMSDEKGPVLAIRAAQAAGVPLVLAAKVDPVERPYFEAEVEPLLRLPGVEFVGEVTDEQKEDLLGRARALLAPIDWPEPFGLMFIEAMACGTPVITRPLGSAPELVEHGRTGLLARTVDELAAAIHDVGRIDRGACRRTFEERFTVERMAASYEAVYRRVMGRENTLLADAAEARSG